MEIVLSLHNIRSTYNVGAIMRTAEGFGVKKLICSGYTPCVKKPGVLPHLADKLNRQIHKTALGAEEMLQIEYSEDIISELENYQKAGFTIVGLENNIREQTILLNDLPALKKLGNKILLVLGEEVNGIPDTLKPQIAKYLEIPMEGQKESFNVSIAAGIALFTLATLRWPDFIL